MVRDDDDLDPDDAGSHAAMLQNKQRNTNNILNKRKEQLQRWESSEMNGEAPHRRKKPRVRFQDSDIFLSACMSGDEDEVEYLLDKGSDINTATVDGLTALHQSVIDSKPEMVRFLCEKGANVNAQDNEGWTPLHAAACCGNLPIVQYLCERGADISIINSDKELALDLADDEGCREFLEATHDSKSIVPDQCRDQELTTMMRDAQKWLREGVYGDAPHSRTGATAMHVAAAKGYTQLLELLIKAGGSIRSTDRDGWTPLHAAAHWAERDSCKILMEHGASIKETNLAGQDVLTVADKEIVEYLEELERAAENRRSLPPSIATGVLQDKNARVPLHHEEHTVSTEHKRELQHRDQSSEKETLAKVPRLAEKSPSTEPDSMREERRVPEEQEEGSTSSSAERMSVERSKSASETPSSARSSEEPMSTASSTSSSQQREREEKSPSMDRSERSTASASSSISASSVASTASSASASSTATSTTSGSSMSTIASTSTPTTSSSLHHSDQHVSATVPLSRPLQQPNSWINRGVQLITRSSSSGSTRMSTESQPSSQQPSTVSSPSTASPSTPLFTKPLPWQSNAVQESEAERRTTARLQRQSRRSTQGVTKEQLEEASKMATEDALRRRGSGQIGYGASSGTAVRENPVLARLASEERDSTSMSSDRSESEKPARIGSATRISADRESDKSTGRCSPPTTSATLSLAAAPSPSSTPSAAGLRRRSQQGMPLSRSNRRGTGPVLPEDLHVATSRVADAVARSNGLSSTTASRPFNTFNRFDPRIGATVPSSQEKASSAPPGSTPTAPTSAPPLRSAAIAPSPAQRVTSRVAVQPIASSASSHNSNNNYQSTPSSSVFSRPTETNLNYKALYEKERTESDRLRREVEELKRNQDNGSVSAFRSVTSRFRNGTTGSGLPLGKSPSGGSIDDVDRRSLERKIAELELQVKAVNQLKMENQRLKEENGALVRVISKMTT